MTEVIKDNQYFYKYIKDNISPKYQAKSVFALDEIILEVKKEELFNFIQELRDDTGTLLSQLVSICGADNINQIYRFEIVYNLLSLKHNFRARIKVFVDDKTAVPSIESLYHSANWFERETYDMYGIKFSDSSDLRRIITDYNFEGFPLRKDFPLTGYKEIRYDEKEQKIVSEGVKLDQEFRNFDFESPWQGEEITKLMKKDGK